MGAGVPAAAAPGDYHRTHGIRYFHGCYSLGDDQLWGVVRRRKSGQNTLAALRSIRARRPDGAPIYVIMDNLSANANYPNHTVLTRDLQAHLRWRNQNARHPDLLAAQRRERARIRSEKGHRWGRPRSQDQTAA